MQWLAQNWLWILLGLGALYFFTRRHGMRGYGMNRGYSHRQYEQNDDYAPPPAAESRPESLSDPVSGQTFSPGSSTVSTVYRGRAYYFASRENRDAFEADPEKYIASAPAAGQSLESDTYRRPHRRRRGC